MPQKSIDHKTYRDIAEYTFDWELWFDAKGKLVWTNDAAERISGYSPKELYKMEVVPASLFIARERTRVKKLFEDALQKKTEGNDVVFFLERKDKKQIPISISWRSMYSPKKKWLGVRASIRNLTSTHSTEKEIKESEERFRKLFETSPIGMALVSPTRKWLQVNAALPKMIGYSQKELLEMTFQDITHKDDLEKDLDLVKKVLKGDIQTYSMVKRYIHKNKSIVWVNLHVSLVRNDAGDPLYFLSQIEDITERKYEQEELERFKAAIEATNNGIYFTDLEGIVTYCNKAMKELTGYTPDEIVGKKAGSLWGGYMDTHFYQEMWDKIKKEKVPYSGELEGRRKGGETFYYRLAITPLTDSESGKLSLFVAIQTDITGTKERIDELEKLTDLMVGRELKMVELKKQIEEKDK